MLEHYQKSGHLNLRAAWGEADTPRGRAICKRPTPESVLELLRDAYNDQTIGREPDSCNRNTTGHQVTTQEEKEKLGKDLLYGEMLPDGLSKAISDKRLKLSDAKLVLELGMGTGKLAMQVFAQAPTVQRIVGVELAPSRYRIGAEALRRLAELPHGNCKLIEDTELTCIAEENGTGRILEFRCGDMFAIHNDIANADAILMEVAFSDNLIMPTCKLMHELKDGCRILIFYRLEEIWMDDGDCPCQPLVDTSGVWDWYSTSWSPNYGHPFFCYECDRSLPVQISAESAKKQRWDNRLTKIMCGGAALLIIPFLFL